MSDLSYYLQRRAERCQGAGMNHPPLELTCVISVPVHYRFINVVSKQLIQKCPQN